MYDDEHPIVVMLAWLLAGAAFAIFLLAKLGAFNPGAGNVPLIEPPQMQSWQGASQYHQAQ